MLLSAFEMYSLFPTQYHVYFSMSQQKLLVYYSVSTVPSLLSRIPILIQESNPL